MAIRIVCPSCRTIYALADGLAGKTVRCKKCNDTFTLPSTDAVPSADTRDKIQTQPQAPRRSAPRDEQQEKAPRLRRRRRDDDDDDLPRSDRSSTRGLVIGLIACAAGLLILAGGAVLLVVLAASQSGITSASARPSVSRRAPVNFAADAGELPNGDPVTRALTQLKSPQPHIRREAVRKLKDTLPDERRAEVIKALEPLLNDSDIFTRKWAVEAIGIWANKDAVPILLKAMQDGDTRREAMKSLGRLKDERAVEPIAQRLEELSEMHAAAEALKAMGPMAEKAVLARLNHHELFVRWKVCEILEAIGTQQSIPVLEKTAASDFHCQIQARKAIAAIRRRQ